jgi:glyoxylate/hydroxypyruvate reductase
MKLLLLTEGFDFTGAWRQAFGRLAPEVELVATDSADEADADAALIYQATLDGRLARLPRLKAIFALAAGVDQLLCDPHLPDVPIVPLANDELAALMREYVIYHCIGMHRRFHEVAALQRQGRWSWMPASPSASTRRVTVLGLGRLGLPAARALSALGFIVSGWSRTPKIAPGIRCRFGSDGLTELLPETDIVVCILPSTAETCGLLSRDLFYRLPRGALLLNAGRGACLNETDLLYALKDGQISHATLDVFSAEPLASDHPFWRHPHVTVTPHLAADASPDAAVCEIATNLRRLAQGVPLAPIVNRTLGY